MRRFATNQSQVSPFQMTPTNRRHVSYSSKFPSSPHKNIWSPTPCGTNAIVNSAVESIKKKKYNFKFQTSTWSFCPGIAVLIGFGLCEENKLKKIVLTKLVLNLFPIISNRTVRETLIKTRKK